MPPNNNSIQSISQSIYLGDVTEEELKKIVSDMSSKHSTGLDDVSNYLIKKTIMEISVPLLYVINLSLEKGTFPTKLKECVVSPIFKKDDKAQVNNYRPITLTSCISKIFEKAFLSRIINFLEKHKFLDSNQFGYQKGKSTTDAVKRAVTHIVKAFNEKNCIMGIFIDLSKAFDCVNIPILCDILDKIGIRGKAGEWILSYLKGRKQCVKLNVVENNVCSCEYSDFREVMYGVPQGSILGPFLFLIYVNIIPILIKNNYSNCIPFVYVDDTSLIITGGDEEILEKDANLIINDTVQSLSSLNLITNTSKTVVVPISLVDKKVQYKVMIEGELIEQVEDVKFLGINFDSHLTWKKHINEICNKVNRGNFLLTQLKQTVSASVLIQVYYANVYSHLVYGINVWGTANKELMTKLLKCQKRSVRILDNLRYRDSCVESFKKMKLLTVPAIFVYFSILDIRRTEEGERFQDVHSYNTRNKTDFVLEKFRGAFAKKSPMFTEKRLYNMLPRSIKDIKSYNQFKCTLKEHLIMKCPYSVDEF